MKFYNHHQNSAMVVIDVHIKTIVFYFATSYICIWMKLILLPGAGSSQLSPVYPDSHTHLSVSTQTALVGHTGEHTEINTIKCMTINNGIGAQTLSVPFVFCM